MIGGETAGCSSILMRYSAYDSEVLSTIVIKVTFPSRDMPCVRMERYAVTSNEYSEDQFRGANICNGGKWRGVHAHVDGHCAEY